MDQGECFISSLRGGKSLLHRVERRIAPGAADLVLELVVGSCPTAQLALESPVGDEKIPHRVLNLAACATLARDCGGLENDSCRGLFVGVRGVVVRMPEVVDENFKFNKKNSNYIFSSNKYSLTNDISVGKKYNENNIYKNSVSEFNIKDNENPDFILVENKTKTNNNINKNSFISKNVTTFSFDFKNHDDYNTNNTNSNINLNLDISDNKENIQDEDDENIIINNNINNAKNYFSFSSTSMLLANERNNSFNNLKNIFVGYITNKFSVFLILLLNRLNLFDFVKILSQKIKKSINQYVYFVIKKDKYYNKNELFFFSTLKRHIWYNIHLNKEDSEIKRLLKENLPKLFKIN